MMRRDSYMGTMAVSGIFLAWSAAALAQTMPGFKVETYATVTDPVRLSFAPDGTLYVGRENAGSGGDPVDAVRIHRISPDGTVVDQYGPQIDDPDAVLFDVDGHISSVPGSVLVGGNRAPGGARITAIYPDETTGIVHDWGTALNPTEMKVDTTGRLVFTSYPLKQVWVSEDGTAGALFTVTAEPSSLALDTADNIYTVANDGTLWKHDAQGIQDQEWPVAPNTAGSIEFGRGGFFGGSLWTQRGGNLYRIDANGNRALVASGCPGGDLAFGPDRALYIAVFDSDEIVRVTPLGDCDEDIDLDLADFSSMVGCVSGPDQPSAPGCECSDMDQDGDIDLADFAMFQVMFSGDG